MTFNLDQFVKDIKAKQAGRALRDLENELHISSSTISRLNNGSMPDLMTYATMCQWMGKSLQDYFEPDFNKKLKSILHLIVNETMRGMGSDRSEVQKLIDEL